MRIDLHFAPGTSEECQRLVKQIPPDRLFDAYCKGRFKYNTHDLVIAVAPEDMDKAGIPYMPRAEYVRTALRRCSEEQRTRLTTVGAFSGIANMSAHQIMKLPAESDTFWVIVEGGPLPVPAMCVVQVLRLGLDGDELITVN